MSVLEKIGWILVGIIMVVIPLLVIDYYISKD